MPHASVTRLAGAALGLAGALALTPAGATAAEDPPMRDRAPQDGYLDAHEDVREPKSLLGGALDITVEQDGGVVFIALPDKRELDTRVFGRPGMPRAYGGSPGINGVPPEMRGKRNGAYTTVKTRTPFGDKHTTALGRTLEITAHDETATDAAVTKDSVDMTASWKDQDGNTYTVTCCRKMAAHGIGFPTFGGVVTNHILHGFTRLGTPLMPTAFAFFAFWGMGEVQYNGRTVAEPHLVHGMLTEYVRQQGYKLAQDHQVRPEEDLHFHLMVPPMAPVPEKDAFKRKPVDTGFTLPDGKMLPFWHVMFEQLDYSARRSG